jgi:hypothetical protein
MWIVHITVCAFAFKLDGLVTAGRCTMVYTQYRIVEEVAA